MVRIAWLALALTACGDDTPDDDSGASADAPTYAEDVAPLMAERCMGCHQDGEIAPFPLTTYDQAVEAADLMANAVEHQRMPPYLADTSGACNDYVDPDVLTDDEIALFTAWADGGTPSGDLDTAPGVPAPPAGLSDFTHTLAMDEAYGPDFDGRDDDYRCFVLDAGLETDGYVTGFEVVPGQTQMVHHVIGYLPNNDDDVAEARALDEADDGPGYECFGGPLVNSNMIASWAPGKAAWEYPEGTGIALPADRAAVVQVHYNNANLGDVEDRSELRLRVESQVDQELVSWFHVNGSIDIPGGEEAWEENQTIKLSRETGYDGALKLWGVGPHMHSIGSSILLSIKHADDTETCVVDVPRWDFNWQFAYWLSDPVVMGPDDKLKLTCVYDSSGREGETSWGDGTEDEMCLMTMYVTVED